MSANPLHAERHAYRLLNLPQSGVRYAPEVSRQARLVDYPDLMAEGCRVARQAAIAGGHENAEREAGPLEICREGNDDHGPQKRTERVGLQDQDRSCTSLLGAAHGVEAGQPDLPSVHGWSDAWSTRE